MQTITQQSDEISDAELVSDKPAHLDVTGKRPKARDPLVWNTQKKRGRPPGTKNFINVRDRCDALGCDPYSIMAMIAIGDHVLLRCRPEEISVGLRLKAASELATYLAPKLKSIEIDKGDKKQENVFVVTLPESGREVTLPSPEGSDDEDEEDLRDTGELDDEEPE